MNTITEQSEQGFKDWLRANNWIDSGDDYYRHDETSVERPRAFLHGLYIAELKLNQ